MVRGPRVPVISIVGFTLIWAFLILFVVSPLTRIFYDAFSNEAGQFTLANFQEFFTDRYYLRSLCNTTAETLNVAAELIEVGASPAYISNKLYETWSKERFDLLVMVLNTLKMIDGVAITFVTREMYQKTGAVAEDTENFPAFLRIMRDVTISAFFRELNDNYWKVSLRSKGDVNVAVVASRFNGGGHKNAAGYEVRSDLESAKKSLLNALIACQQREGE